MEIDHVEQGVLAARRTGDPDCNDNTQTLQSQEKGSQPEDVALAEPVTSSPNHSTSLQTGRMAEAMAGLAYSPEDTLNNDFFYDDEFSVPFDANLMEGCESEMLVDSMDLGGLLSVSGLVEGGAVWQTPHMVNCRSDTCLYQGELDLSYSDGNSQFSQELSHSEQEGLSSSELSDLRSEPLFSPAPSHDILPALAEPLDHLKEGDLDVTLTSSGYSNEPNKYSFDFTAHKDHYMFAFDRSPSKGSSEDSCHSMTSWAQKSTVSQQSWGSAGSKGSLEEHSSNSSDKSMTSWGELRRRKEQPLTTWKQLVEELDALPQDPNGPRSRSLPELKSCYARSKSHDGHCQLTESCKEWESARRPASMSLFEVFQRYRTPDGLEMEGNEAMISPNSLQKLTGTWSMSPVSSEPSHQSPLSPAEPRLTCHKNVAALVSWNTVCNLTQTSPENAASPAPSPSLGSPASETLASIYKSGCTSNHWSFSEVATKAADAVLDVSTQTSSGVLTLGQRTLRGWCDVSVQFPPRVRDCAVQTSVESLEEKKHKCLQTSVEYSVQCRHCGRCEQEDSIQAVDNIKLSKHADHRLTCSIHLMSEALPDLSFLNKGCKSAQGMTAQGGESNMQEPVNKPIRGAHMHRGRAQITRCRRTSSSDSRESSPGLMIALQPRRLRNSDSGSNSFCSSSSSGIDPGSSESTGTKTPAEWRNFSPGTSEYSLASDSGTECLHKDMRIKTSGRRISRRDMTREKKDLRVAGLCCMCRAKCQAVTEIQMAYSHPTYSNSQKGVRCKQVEYLQLSPTAPHGPKKVLHPRISGSCPVKLRWHGQSQPIQSRPVSLLSKPLKPCLRKNGSDRRSAVFKHRSWAGTSDLRVVKLDQGNVTSSAGGSASRQAWGKQTTRSRSKPGPCSALGQQVLEKLIREPNSAAHPGSPKPTRTATPPNSPELEALLLCGCGQMMAPPGVEGESTMEMSRAKKTVSFSEQICYHSPHVSPHPSPKKQAVRCPVQEKMPLPVSGLSLGMQAELGPELNSSGEEPPNDFAPDSSGDEAPNDFSVSPTDSSSPDYPYGPVPTDAKSEMVHTVVSAVQALTDHIGGKPASPQQQIQVSSPNVSVSELVMTKLCPALYDLVEHGLRPHLHSLFGKVKNSVWKVVEYSTELGPSTKALNQVVMELKFLTFTEPQLKFSAFVFGLLNRGQLAYWFGHLQQSERLLAKLYTEDSLLWQSRDMYSQQYSTMHASLTTLAQLPFRLQYDEINQHIASPAPQLSHSDSAKSKSDTGTQLLGKLVTSQTVKPWLTKSFDRFWSASRSATDFSSRPRPSSEATSLSLDLEPHTAGAIAAPQMGPVLTKPTSPATHKGCASTKPILDMLERDSDEDEQREKSGVLSRLAKHFKEATWPETPERVYKTGVTEYTFDGGKSHSSAAPLRVSDSAVQLRNAMAQSKQSNLPGSSPAAKVPRSQSVTCDGRSTSLGRVIPQQWSDLQTMDPGRGTPTQRDGSSVQRAVFKKTWNSLGPTLINIFDKLLLPEQTGEATSAAQAQPHQQQYSWNSHTRHGHQCRAPHQRAPIDAPCRKQIQRTVSSDKTWYVQALCHYAATQPDELSFDKSEVLTVVKEVDSDWLLCRHGDFQGLVHRGCVKVAEDAQIFDLLHDDFYR